MIYCNATPHNSSRCSEHAELIKGKIKCRNCSKLDEVQILCIFPRRVSCQIQSTRSAEDYEYPTSNSGVQCNMCFCLSAFHMLETSFMMSTFFTPGFLRLSSWIFSRW
jgi:hypothetical protein